MNSQMKSREKKHIRHFWNTSIGNFKITKYFLIAVVALVLVIIGIAAFKSYRIVGYYPEKIYGVRLSKGEYIGFINGLEGNQEAVLNLMEPIVVHRSFHGSESEIITVNIYENQESYISIGFYENNLIKVKDDFYITENNIEELLKLLLKLWSDEEKCGNVYKKY